MKTVVKVLPQKSLPFSVNLFQYHLGTHLPINYKAIKYLNSIKPAKVFLSTYRKKFISSSYVHVFAFIYAKYLLL